MLVAPLCGAVLFLFVVLALVMRFSGFQPLETAALPARRTQGGFRHDIVRLRAVPEHGQTAPHGHPRLDRGPVIPTGYSFTLDAFSIYIRWPRCSSRSHQHAGLAAPALPRVPSCWPTPMSAWPSRWGTACSPTFCRPDRAHHPRLHALPVEARGRAVLRRTCGDRLAVEGGRHGQGAAADAAAHRQRRASATGRCQRGPRGRPNACVPHWRR